MKTKKRKPAKKPVAPPAEPMRMYLGHMRTEKQIASLERLRVEAVQQHNDWLQNRKPSWL